MVSIKNSFGRMPVLFKKADMPLGISFMENTKKAFVCVSFLPVISVQAQEKSVICSDSTRESEGCLKAFLQVRALHTAVL